MQLKLKNEREKEDRQRGRKMILKMSNEDGWKFIDKVDRLQTVEEAKEGEPKRIVKIIAQTQHEVNVVIETTDNPYAVYLLNDEGKTIERLN